MADALVAALSLALALLFWSGRAAVWHVYVIMSARALANSFHWPAMQASTSLLVPEEHLARIGGLNQTMSGVSGIVSPIIGALLLDVSPIHGIMGLDVVTALLAIGPLLAVSIPQPGRADGAAAPTLAALRADFAGGLRFIAGWPGLVLTLGLALTINLLANPAFALVPILVTQHLGGMRRGMA
jgi:DHA3 family macrolide efflux protein-like MFS transporter